MINKLVSAVIVAAFSITAVAAQTSAVANPQIPFPAQFFTGGLNYNSQTSPEVTGYVAYAPVINQSSGLYSYTAVDVTSVTKHPFRVQTQISTGAAKWIGTFSGFDWFALGAAGAAFNTNAANTATNIGAALSTGVFATKPLGKKGVFLTLTGKMLYSSTGGIQGPFGIGLGWGK